jgi:hypothetical protein
MYGARRLLVRIDPECLPDHYTTVLHRTIRLPALRGDNETDHRVA